MADYKIPVIVGASQYKQSRVEPCPLDAVGLMKITSIEAFKDAGSGKLPGLIDTVCMTNVFGWSYRDAPGMLCERLDIKAKKRVFPFVGGNYPQKFVNNAAAAIACGESRAVLITGGEAEYAVRRAKRGEVKLDWPAEEEVGKFDGGNALGTSDFENTYNLLWPIGIYVFFETILKEISGRTWEEHNAYIGSILERFSAVAGKNPLAWSGEKYTCKEIITPSEKNRYLCYPYTMRMMANRLVDMSAAIIMTDTDTATRLGIDRKKWVYPMGGADIENIYYTTRRPILHTSPAARHGSRLSLEQAGVGLDDIGIIDIYSCFPSMIQIFLNEIFLKADDGRGLTITGGLPYFGAPLSNYSMHAIATAVERIRKDPSLTAFIAALGGLNTKPSFGIYGSEPGAERWGGRDDSAIQRDILSETLPVPEEASNGPLHIDAYAIHYGRNGSPELGTVTGTLESGTRTLAHIKAGPEELSDIINKKIIGRTVDVKFDAGAGKNIVSA